MALQNVLSRSFVMTPEMLGLTDPEYLQAHQSMNTEATSVLPVIVGQAVRLDESFTAILAPPVSFNAVSPFVTYIITLRVSRRSRHHWSR